MPSEEDGLGRSNSLRCARPIRHLQLAQNHSRRYACSLPVETLAVSRIRRPAIVTLLADRGARLAGRGARRSPRHASPRDPTDGSKRSATRRIATGSSQSLRSHLSLALASATDCHCIFSGASIPPQASGSTLVEDAAVGAAPPRFRQGLTRGALYEWRKPLRAL